MGPGAGLGGRKISSPPGFDPGPSLYRLSYPTHYLPIFRVFNFPHKTSGKIKGKVIPLQAVVAQRVGTGIALLFHDLDTRRG